MMIFLSACSQGPNTRAKLKVTSSFAVTGFSGGVMLYVINPDLKTQRAINMTEDSVTLSLPNGKWDFAIIGWNGAESLSGTAECAYVNSNLTSTDTEINLEMTPANCNNDFFSPSAYRAAGELNSLRMLNCKSIAAAASGVSCDDSQRGKAGSYSVHLVAHDELPLTSVSLMDLGNKKMLSSVCVSAAAPSSITNLPYQIPTGSSKFKMPFIVDVFEDSSCGIPLKSFYFPSGPIGPETSIHNAKIFSSASYTDIYLELAGLTVLQAGLDFGDRILNTIKTQFITITNDTSSPVSALSMTLSGPFAFSGGSYPGTGGTCGNTIPAAGDCTIAVGFNPTTAGIYSVQLSISYFDGKTMSMTKLLTGTGLAPALLAFSVQNYELRTLLRTEYIIDMTVTNNGAVTANDITGVTTGPDAALFVVASNCGTSIAPLSQCTITVKFNPTVEGDYTALHTLTYDNGLISNASVFANIVGRGRELWIPDAAIKDMVEIGNELFVGGSFTNFSRPVGSGVILNSAGGFGEGSLAPIYTNGLRQVPRVEGIVYASVSDGAGGYYIGGFFSKVGSHPASNLAHINDDGTVDINFTINANSQVYALALSGTTLFLGGAFNAVNGNTRSKLAAIDTISKTLLPFNPTVNGNIYSLLANGTTLYVGGLFTNVSGSARINFAAIDTTTVTVTGITPEPDGAVYAMAIDDSNLYLGGDFNTLGGQTRNFMGVINTSTGMTTSFNPNFNMKVNVILIAGPNLFVGGQFSSVSLTPRKSLAKFSLVTETLDTFDLSFNSNESVYSLATNGSDLFVGGNFKSVNGEARSRFASVDSGTGTLRTLNPSFNNSVRTIATHSGTIFAGGEYSGISAVPRHKLAAINTETGAPTNFNPNVAETDSGDVTSLASDGLTLYVGGLFVWTTSSRNNLASIDVSTGLFKPWNPNPNGGVNALHIMGDGLYVGGSFSSIDGQSRNNLAKFDAGTGAFETGFNSNLSGAYVSAIGDDSYEIIIGGLFTTPSPVKTNLTKVDYNTGAHLNYNIDANNTVNSIIYDGTNIIVGGIFTTLGGVPRNRIGKIDSVGSILGWSPNASGLVSGMAVTGPGNMQITVIGQFTTISSQTRPKIVDLDISFASAVGPSYNFNGTSLVSIFSSNNRVFVSGVFNQFRGDTRANFAVYTLP